MRGDTQGAARCNDGGPPPADTVGTRTDVGGPAALVVNEKSDSFDS